MKRKPLVYTYNIIGMAVLLFLLGRTYLPYIERYINRDNQTYITSIIFACILIVSCLIPTLFIKKMLSMNINIFKAKYQPDFILYIICGQASFFASSLIFNMIFIWISTNFGVVFNDIKILPIENTFTFIVYYIYIAIVPAIIEEIFVRGYILNALIPHGKVLAIVMSSVIFAVMHQDLKTIPPIFISSMILGLLYIITDNIYICMATHCFNNSFAFMAMYVSEYMNTPSNLSFVFKLNLSIIFTGVILFFVLKYKNKSQNLFEGFNTNGLTKGVLKIFKSPTLLVSIIICLIGSIEVFINVQ